jgi:hypothetical protein
MATTATRDSELVGAAGHAMVKAVRTLGQSRTRRVGTALITRGEHPLWSDVERRLCALGSPLFRYVLDPDDQRWAPPIPLGRNLIRFAGQIRPVDTVIFHDPFHSVEPVNSGSSAVRELLAVKIGLIFVDFPHGVHDRGLGDLLTDVYLRALSEPADTMRSLSERIEAALDTAVAVEIIDIRTNEITLRAERPWTVRSDWSAAVLDHPILQLPFGEVWIACHRVRAAAVVCCDGEEPIEVGIGLNRAAPWLPQTVLAEKSIGRVHLGYGDNELLGGTVRADRHFDRALPATFQLRLEVSDGSRVNLDDFFDGGSRTAREVMRQSVHARCAGLLDDLAVGETLHMVAGQSFARYGIATSDGVVCIGGRRDHELGAVWSWLLRNFGILPWGYVELLTARELNPKGLSLPGTVCIDRTMIDASPLTGRFLYLVHELIHQWFGNLVRFDVPEGRWEPWIDALACYALQRAVTPSVVRFSIASTPVI